MFSCSTVLYKGLYQYSSYFYRCLFTLKILIFIPTYMLLNTRSSISPILFQILNILLKILCATCLSASMCLDLYISWGELKVINMGIFPVTQMILKFQSPLFQAFGSAPGKSRMVLNCRINLNYKNSVSALWFPLSCFRIVTGIWGIWKGKSSWEYTL